MHTDTQRLDWLSKQERHPQQDYDSGEWGISCYEGNINDQVFKWLVHCSFETLREAIDAAMIKYPQ